jgi:undecaprenyl-diphosphatase
MQAIILGVIQGLTEFLPVSSTGHLVVAGHLLRVADTDLAFEAMIHLGTLLAVLFFFRRRVRDLAAALWRGRVKWHRGRLRFPNDNTRLAWMLIAASIPAAVAGMVFEAAIEQYFLEPFWVGVFMVVTGVLLFLAGIVPQGERRLGWGSAAAVGLAQACAILPGLSRSGATISAGIFAGVERTASAEFSFLLSIPVILGASSLKLLKALDRGFPDGQAACLLAGVAAAALVGLGAIKLLMAVVARGKLAWFAVYCWLAGIALIFYF